MSGTSALIKETTEHLVPPTTWDTARSAACSLQGLTRPGRACTQVLPFRAQNFEKWIFCF